MRFHKSTKHEVDRPPYSHKHTSKHHHHHHYHHIIITITTNTRLLSPSSLRQHHQHHRHHHYHHIIITITTTSLSLLVAGRRRYCAQKPAVGNAATGAQTHARQDQNTQLAVTTPMYSLAQSNTKCHQQGPTRQEDRVDT